MATRSQNIEIDFYYISRHIGEARQLFKDAQNLHFDFEKTEQRLTKNCMSAKLNKAAHELEEAAALLRLLTK